MANTKEAERLFYSQVDNCGFTIIGKFENEHGERFVLYDRITSNGPLITGDEFDWDWGIEYRAGSQTAAKYWLLSEHEAELALSEYAKHVIGGPIKW